MFLHQYTIKNKSQKRETYYIAILGDTHYGTKSFDKRQFLEMIQWIKKRKNVYWIGLGDYVEAITPRDLRRFAASNVCPDFAIDDLEEIAQRQIDDFVKMTRPIASRCIGLADGNHEFTYLKEHDRNITKAICKALKVKHLCWTSITRLKFTRGNKESRVINVLTEHSNVAGRKKGNKVNRIEDRLNDWHDIDIIIWGHSHDKVATSKTQLYMPRRGRLCLKARKIICVICPSFYKTYEVGTTSYGERAGYPPVTTGMALIEIRPFVGNKNEGARCEMHVSQ